MSESFTRFQSPALQAPKDYKALSMESELPLFEQNWSINVNAWTNMSIIGNPWSSLHDAPRSGYYNPLTDGGFGTSDVVIKWDPFPNRLVAFLTQSGAAQNPQLGRALTMDEVMGLADTGEITINNKLLKLYDPDKSGDVLKIPTDRCPDVKWGGPFGEFSPSGPRGWLDEYCEWSITYNDDGKMTGVMFTCENPAYYLTMWRINPKAVLGIYQQTIDPAIQLEDLYLRYTVDQPTGKKGEPVIDPTTGNPAYNAVNKWNYGPKRVPGKSGGAIHLTSAPNTLSAEVYLAAAGTIQRPDASSGNPQTLICCAQYGQNFRNSDPHIGFVANGAAATSLISLTDPVGLYIQQPVNFANWKGPNGEDVSQYWKITRGTAGTGPNGSDQILHVTFDIPESAGFTLNDVTIGGTAVDHIGVIVNQMKIALSVTAKPTTETPKILPCVANRTDGLQPWPVQFVPSSLFYGLSTSDLPSLLNPGSKNEFVLVVQGASKDTTAGNARVEFSDSSITAKVSKFLPNASAIPGQTDGGGTQAYILTVSVAASASPGPVMIRVLNPDEGNNPSASDHPWEDGLAIVPAS